MTLPPLPIDDVLLNLIAAVQQHGSAVLKAPTGAGKTTRVPPAFWRAGLAERGAILVLQPRRIAARATAVRMAREQEVELGREIGFQTRFERRVSRESRVICITEGILLRRLIDDPFLDGVATVVFDEFHERNLASDLALAMTRQLQQTVRPDLQLVVMSATLDPTPLASYLGDCAAIESQGRTYPVRIEHTRELDRRPIDEAAADGVWELLPRTAGDLLVFLPGVREIKATARRLAQLGQQGVAVLELYGDLPPEKQDAVLRRSSDRRVILSTNVAETSLTIEGVTGVVDTGWARVSKYDEHTGLDRLELTPISQASADQRAGRAGRTAPGICLRLWTEAAHRARPLAETPEVRRVDLSSAALQLACWIEPDPAVFPWYEPPRAAAWETAVRLLHRLGAMHKRAITPLGQRMASIPLAPRLARMLIDGDERGDLSRVALAAALLSERDPVQAPATGRKRDAQHTSESDLLDRLAAMEAFERSGQTESESGTLHKPGAQAILTVRDQLLRSFPKAPAAHQLSDTALLRAVLAGFPDRVARRRELGSRRAVMVGGRGVRLSEQSAVDQHELFVCLDIDGAQGEALVRMASGVKREWLPEELLTVRVDVEFDAARGQLLARRRVLWDDLLLEESPAALPHDEASAAALATAAREYWSDAFPHDQPAVAGFVARVRFLARHRPELDLPSLDDAWLQSLLPGLCRGRRSLSEVRQAPWLDYLCSALNGQQLQVLEREAPERIAVPSGNRIAIDYAAARPTLAVRIQELFGMMDTPRLAGGRVPLLLHLLAPNMRPQQITDDLRSFWINTYPQVRKDLRGRYPKHAWPEDPLTATAKPRK
jgi:ATP-dependent helicase HrpB